MTEGSNDGEDNDRRGRCGGTIDKCSPLDVGAELGAAVSNVDPEGIGDNEVEGGGVGGNGKSLAITYDSEGACDSGDSVASSTVIPGRGRSGRAK